MRTNVLAALLICSLAQTTGRAQTRSLESDFETPPHAARPALQWHWVRDRVDAIGITEDLTAFRAKGFGQVTIIPVGANAGNMPFGPRFMSDEWRAMVKHAVSEGARVGVEVNIGPTSGWVMGGPWITPDRAQQCVTTGQQVLVGPQRFAGTLQQPPGNAEHYRDVAVQAFRIPEEDAPNPVKVSASANGDMAWQTIDNNWATKWEPNANGKAAWLQLEFERPITADRILLQPVYRFGKTQFTVRASDDGLTFRDIGLVNVSDIKPDRHAFPSTRARFFRIHNDTWPGSRPGTISEIAVGTAAQIERLFQLRCATGSDWAGRYDAPVAPATQPVAAATTPVDTASVVDLTTRVGPDGTLEWDVPDGRWLVLRTGHTITGKQTGQTPGGQGPEVDFFSKAAIELQFKSIADVLVRDAGPHAGTALKRFFEDSWEAGSPNWTPELPTEFQRRRGYDPRPYLPALSGWVVGDPGTTDRFLYDFRRTVADCMADNHFRRFTELAHAHDMLTMCQAAGPFFPKAPLIDSLLNLGQVDVPMGEFWLSPHHSHHPGGTDAKHGSKQWMDEAQNTVGKQTASAAHVYGKRLVAAEAFTDLSGRTNYGHDLADLKPAIDRAFAEGMNFASFHGATAAHSADGVPGNEFAAGTHFNRHVTWWTQIDAFSDYVARCQALLQRGLFVADVCFYYGDDVPAFVPAKHVNASLGVGYDYDVCNTDVLLNRMSVRDGRIVLPDGMSYRLLVLPDRDDMPVEVMEKIQTLVDAGATVVGPRPSRATGLHDRQAKEDRLRQSAAAVWGDCDGKTVTRHAYGRGRVVWGRTPAEVLKADGIVPDFTHKVGPADGLLDYIHRRDGGSDVYFVCNRRDREEPATLTFRVTGRRPELWDPLTGERRDAGAYDDNGTTTTLDLRLEPYGSVFVVFQRPATATTMNGANQPTYEAAATLDGPWAVRFDPTWGGPAEAGFDRLTDWTQRPEEGIKHYSGTATYRITFDAPDGVDAARLAVDLGVVHHVAEVRLNGESAGIAWTPPFRVRLPATLKSSGNVLEIDVVNLWRNRLIGDAGLPKEKRLARTNIPFKSTLPLTPSGLIGPVRLMHER